MSLQCQTPSETSFEERSKQAAKQGLLPRSKRPWRLYKTTNYFKVVKRYVGSMETYDHLEFFSNHDRAEVVNAWERATKVKAADEPISSWAPVPYAGDWDKMAGIVGHRMLKDILWDLNTTVDVEEIIGLEDERDDLLNRVAQARGLL